jgi:NAD(P)H-hydrate epimerase
VIPVVTPSAMKAIDAAATAPVDVLIDRAGAAVARVAIDMLGSTYGRRVAVIAGPGNNGADGRVAAERLRRRGVAVTVFDARQLPDRLPPVDLVIDAAYGTGFHGEWSAPDPGGAPVLAVDVPTGLDAATGHAGPGVLAADRTVTFAAAKPGHVLGDGPDHTGLLTVAEIGLDVDHPAAQPACGIVERSDVAGWLPDRPPDAHKWQAAVRVVAGSTGMTGAAWLASAAAQRTGAGMVVVSSPGTAPAMPIEAVQRRLDASGWAAAVLGDIDRFHSVVIGPGLGVGDADADSIREVVHMAPIAVLVDGDGLRALAEGGAGWQQRLAARSASTVLTPHEGEFARLAGAAVGHDRFGDVRRLADTTGAVVLLKGRTTIVAEPGGMAYVIDAGDQRLATAGTGDVLSGMIGALLAQHVYAAPAAASGAWLHARAAAHGPRHGLIASDLIAAIPAALAEVLP